MTGTSAMTSLVLLASQGESQPQPPTLASIFIIIIAVVFPILYIATIESLSTKGGSQDRDTKKREEDKIVDTSPDLES